MSMIFHGLLNQWFQLYNIQSFNHFNQWLSNHVFTNDFNSIMYKGFLHHNQRFTIHMSTNGSYFIITNGFYICTNDCQTIFLPMIFIRLLSKVFYITTNDLQFTCQPMVLVPSSPTVFTSAPMIVNYYQRFCKHDQ